MSLLDDLRRPVPWFPRWRYHAGHAAVASVWVFVAFALGAPLWLACAIGTIGFPILHELHDVLQPGGTSSAGWRDHAADLVQHQPPWIVWALVDSGPVPALAVAIVIGALYVLTLEWSVP